MYNTRIKVNYCIFLHFNLMGMTNYHIGSDQIASNHISDYICKRDIIISKAKPKSTGISFRANKPPEAQLAHYKLGRHKISIRTSVAYISCIQ